MLFNKRLNIVDCDVFRYTRDNAYFLVELGCEEEAKNAIELLNDTQFMNRKLRVNNFEIFFVDKSCYWHAELLGFIFEGSNSTDSKFAE